MNLTHLIFLAAILVGILIITHWAAKTNTTPQQFYIVSGNLTATQNGLAIAGDFISAASFLGITGSIAFYGFDGFLYAVGFLISYLLLLFFIAEPIRRLGTYTLGDVIAARFPERPIRLMVSLNTITICVLYMVPQLMAAGLFIQLLLGLDYQISVLVIGLLITVYVMFGGMITTSWVQIIKTVLLMTGTFLLCLLVLARFRWDPGALLARAAAESPYAEGFFRAGNLLTHPLETFSLLLTLILGTAGLPHILIRFYTVRDQRAVRQSVVIASWIIGTFYLMTLILGLGAVALVGRDRLATADPEGNLAAPLLAHTLGGDFVMAFLSAAAFATILAVMTGLVIAATSSFAHDIYNHLLHRGKAGRRQQLKVARGTAAVTGASAIFLSLLMEPKNVTFLVSLAFMMAGSTQFPLLLLTLYWRKFTAFGAVAGMIAGLLASLWLVLPGGTKLENPGILAIPLGFAAAVIGTWLTRRPEEERRFDRILLRVHAGIEPRKGGNQEWKS